MLREGNQVQDQKRGLEETYEKLFAKMGRDFIHKDDFRDFIDKLILALGSAIPGFEIEIDDSRARSKAAEYKEVLDEGKDGSKKYEDLVDIFEEK